MIVRIENLPNNLPKTLLSARITALYNTYKDSVGIDLFCQTVDGRLTAVFGGIGNSYSLCVMGNADFKELNEFFSFSKAVCFCDGNIAENLSPKVIKTAKLYELVLKPAPAVFPYCNAHEPIKTAYEILQSGTDGDITLPLFDYWYTDFCVRFNHNSAEYAVLQNAVAVAGFMTEYASLITGVAVKQNERKKGFGTAALKILIHNIWGKYPESKIYAATENAGGFYEKLNFNEVGTVADCRY